MLNQVQEHHSINNWCSTQYNKFSKTNTVFLKTIYSTLLSSSFGLEGALLQICIFKIPAMELYRTLFKGSPILSYLVQAISAKNGCRYPTQIVQPPPAQKIWSFVPSPDKESSHGLVDIRTGYIQEHYRNQITLLYHSLFCDIHFCGHGCNNWKLSTYYSYHISYNRHFFQKQQRQADSFRKPSCQFIKADALLGLREQGTYIHQYTYLHGTPTYTNFLIITNTSGLHFCARVTFGAWCDAKIA